MLKKYGNFIQEHERWEFTEKMNETTENSRKLQYTPNHPIQKEPSITSKRIVYESNKGKDGN